MFAWSIDVVPEPAVYILFAGRPIVLLVFQLDKYSSR